MLYRLRHLKASFGRTLTGMLLLAWLAAALQPCPMAGVPMIHRQATAQAAGHEHCIAPQTPASAHIVPAQPCPLPGCDLQAIDQQSPGLLQVLLMGSLFMIAAVMLVVWPRLTRTAPGRIALRAPPPRPHPTLAFCTLLI